MSELRGLVVAGPDPTADKVVRWRCRDLRSDCSQQLGWQALETLRHRQASALAYFDCFWILAVLAFVLAFRALLMKRSVAEKVLTR
jgi:hypothetical protein